MFCSLTRNAINNASRSVRINDARSASNSVGRSVRRNANRHDHISFNRSVNNIITSIASDIAGNSDRRRFS